ncbi:MAG: fatty acid desaturase [Pseudomonadota bacterium]|nr:fatty acid desaturase [Pseudomonadota bacterium]
MWHGILEASTSFAIWSALGLSHITIIGVTVFLHRCQAHRALELAPSVSHFFRFWMWLTTGMITKNWVAVHRKHHAKAETQEDPHSPIIFGLNRVLWNGVGLYRREAKKSEVIKKYGHGTPNDWIEKNIYTPFHRHGVFLMLALNILFFGGLGFLVWAIQMLWIPFFAAGVINGVGHYFGYRNFELKDNARNIIPFGFLIGGEELHNNHHAYGASAKLSVKWYEFDYGWFIIKTLSRFGLAKVKRTIPDLEGPQTLSTRGLVEHVLYNKIQLFEKYCSNVIKPVFKDNKIKQYFPRAKKLLIKEMSSISISDTRLIEDLLTKCDSLKVVYEFRKNLEDICKTNKSSFDDIYDSLQSWCRKAEATGIDELEKFAYWLEDLINRTKLAT